MNKALNWVTGALAAAALAAAGLAAAAGGTAAGTAGMHLHGHPGHVAAGPDMHYHG